MSRFLVFTAALSSLLIHAGQTRAAIITYDVSGRIDTADSLIIKDGTLQWSHTGTGAAVGRHGGGNTATTISSATDAVVQMSAVQWTPTWPEPPPAEIRYAAVSSVFSGLTPVLPEESPISVSASVISGRGSVTITQIPSPANDFTLIARFADGFGGSATTRGLITVNVPEPGGVGIVVATLAAAGLRRRRSY